MSKSKITLWHYRNCSALPPPLTIIFTEFSQNMQISSYSTKKKSISLCIPKANDICVNKTQAEIYQIMDYYKELQSNVTKQNCVRPCLTMDVYFGVLFNDGLTYDGSSYLKIYLKPTVKVQETVYDYTVLSLLAEIGGYTGLFLGASVANLTIIIEKIKEYINWIECSTCRNIS